MHEFGRSANPIFFPIAIAAYFLPLLLVITNCGRKYVIKCKMMPAVNARLAKKTLFEISLIERLTLVLKR